MRPLTCVNDQIGEATIRRGMYHEYSRGQITRYIRQEKRENPLVGDSTQALALANGRSNDQCASAGITVRFDVLESRSKLQNGEGEHTDMISNWIVLASTQKPISHVFYKASDWWLCVSHL